MPFTRCSRTGRTRSGRGTSAAATDAATATAQTMSPNNFLQYHIKLTSKSKQYHGAEIFIAQCNINTNHKLINDLQFNKVAT